MQLSWTITLKKIPFARLLLALIAGIVLQWYCKMQLPAIIIVLVVATLLSVLYPMLPAYKKFEMQWLRGFAIMALFAGGGAFITWFSNIEHRSDWFQKYYANGTVIIGTVNEPLTDKPNSYKTVIKVTGILKNNKLQPASGFILTYFKKDSLPPNVVYGSQLAFTKSIQNTQSTGNPGAFNFKQYLLFQGITSQVYLQPGDYTILPGNDGSGFQKFLQNIQTNVIACLQKNIPGKQEQGVAEALLIGFRGDLDKSLVQSYSNTGVVHIIAISGMHLGMIYGVLLWCFSPFKYRRWYKIIMPVTVIVVLWLFTFVAGAVPSISRSAIMFTFIVCGEFLNRKTNIYNTLAASAFCLLVYNPFYLWDVGFQLSYTAVISIVVFMKPIYKQLYITNKILDGVWKLVATNLAAQVFTLPLVLYYFHQFPLLFLVTNLFVIPLSTIILFGEIVLVLLAKIAAVAAFVGKIANWCLWVMNEFIKHMEQMPDVFWVNAKVDLLQAIVGYAVVVLLTSWLFFKHTKPLMWAMCLLLFLAAYTAVDIVEKRRQHQLLVYNIPKHTAIEFLQGNDSKLVCDSTLINDTTAQNFTLKPARVLHRSTNAQYAFLGNETRVFHLPKTTIIVVTAPLSKDDFGKKLKADVVIISGNPRLYINQLVSAIDAPIIVADNTNPQWKIGLWKKDCDSLHLRFHSTALQGAFVMNL